MTEYAVLIPGRRGRVGRKDEAERQAMYGQHTSSPRCSPNAVTRSPAARSSHAAQAPPVRREARRAGVTEGPYAETVEQLAGFYLSSTDDLDDLLDVRRHPGRGRRALEVRPASTSSGGETQRSTSGDRRATTSAPLARRVGPAAGPARRAVPPARPGRGRPRRRLRGGRPHLAADGVPDQPAGLAAHRRPAPDRRPAARRGGRRPQAAAARRGGRADRGGAARDGRRRRGGAATSGCGWCCSAPTRRWRPRRPRRSPCGWCSVCPPPTSRGCSWCRRRRWPPG